MIKKFLPVMPRKFSNDLFALKKCCILHIENLTVNKKNSGIKLLMNIVLISYLLHTFLKYEIKNWGQWCKFRDIGQNIQIFVKNEGWFYSDFWNLCQLFSKSSLWKSIRIVLNIIWILFQISLTYKKSSASRNKDILNTIPTY